MRARGGAFAHGGKPRERGLAPNVHRDPAHMIMRGRRDRDEVTPRIQARGLAGGEHGGEMVGEMRADGRARIEKGAAPGCALEMDRPRHHIARGEFGDEAFARAVDERCAFPRSASVASGRIAPHIERGGMKLHIPDRDQRAARAAIATPARAIPCSS